MSYKHISKDGFQNPYKEFNLPLAANQRLRVAYDTSYFRLLQATGNIKVNFFGQAGDTTVIGAGIGVKFDPIPWVEIIDVSGAPNTVIIGLGICEIFDSRFTAGGITIVNQTKSANIGTVADITLNNGAITPLLGADATRRSAIITSDPANTQNLRIGDGVNTGAARGTILQIGQTITIDSGAAIGGFAPAAGQKVSITTILD